MRLQLTGPPRLGEEGGLPNCVMTCRTTQELGLEPPTKMDLSFRPLLNTKRQLPVSQKRCSYLEQVIARLALIEISSGTKGIVISKDYVTYRGRLVYRERIFPFTLHRIKSRCQLSNFPSLVSLRFEAGLP